MIYDKNNDVRMTMMILNAWYNCRRGRRLHKDNDHDDREECMVDDNSDNYNYEEDDDYFRTWYYCRRGR